MNDSPENIAKLKSLIDRLGDHWNETWPTDPDKYQGTEHLVIFTYNIAHDWPSFYILLREARKEIDTIIDTEQL